MSRLQLMVERLKMPVGNFVKEACSWHVSNELVELTVVYCTACKQANL